MNKLTLIVFLLPFLSACLPKMPDMSLPTLYRDDIHQGSVLERFKINQLKLGMSKAQVQNLIGSPSIIDPFHNNQWDYINHSTLHKKNDIHYRLVLKFNDDVLTHVNTTGIDSLSQLNDKEKVAENKRISDEKAAEKTRLAVIKLAQEKAKIEAERIAQEKVRKKTLEIAQEKALAEAKVLEQERQKAKLKKAKALEQRRIQDEKATAEKAKADTIRMAKEKTQLLKEKRLQEKNKPWYQFW
jgi:outer membrane protein assembly factor BamE